jgi:hypothetical protein
MGGGDGFAERTSAAKWKLDEVLGTIRIKSFMIAQLYIQLENF